MARAWLPGSACNAPAQDGGGGSLSDALAAMPEVTAHLDRAAIERLTDPANYLGAAPETVDRVLAGAARGA